MTMIGLTLTVVFIFMGVYMYRSHLTELRSTMAQVLDPLDEPTGRFREIDHNARDTADTGQSAPESAVEPPFDGERPEFPPRGDRRKDDFIGDTRIITVFYDQTSGEISIISGENDVDDEIIGEAVPLIASSEEKYGRLNGYSLIYMKEGVGAVSKIAIADTSYITGRFLRNVIWLAIIYLAAMGVFFIVSLRLSRRAARPMENAIEMERQFVADISHDLKTPITVILANNSILKDNADASVASQSQWIESTDDAAKNMMGLINEMLTLSSLEAQEKTVVPVKVDLSAAAEKAVLQMESVAFERGVEMKADIAPNVSVSATKEYVDRIISALIENALKYEKDGGRIELSLSSAKKTVTLSVRNLSSFIDPADINHIFERFYRADKARSATGGHGLGLPIVKQMADTIGASVFVTSSPSDGTTFTVEFVPE